MTSCRRFPAVPVWCVIGGLVLSGCGKPEHADAHSKTPPAATQIPAAAQGIVVLGANAPELQQITIAPVQTVPVPADEVTAPARIEANPNRIGHAVLPLQGRILKVFVKLGDSVQHGQPVVEIESPTAAEAEAGYVQANSSVHQAQTAITKADADLARLTDLFEHQAVAQKEVLAAQTTAALAKSSLEQAQSARAQARRRLELLGLNPGETAQRVTVVAPISGKVLELSVVEGEYRNEISTPLLTIADLSRVWATSEVPESQIRYCKLGGIFALELIAYPNETFHARVTRIADTVDRETRTIRVSAELDNRDGRFRPEMFGNLRYADGLVPLPWVPDSAVIRIGDKDYVFREQSQGRFVSSPVTLGKRHNGGFAVAGGLKAGDRVVTQGSVYLKASL
jgi:membrane fusion protein, heavy metal efflux system